MKNFKLLLIFMLLHTFGYAQDRKNCTYTDYITVSDYIKECPISNSKTNELLVNEIDSLLKKINEKRNFEITICNTISQPISAIIDPYFGPMDKTISIPTDVINLKITNSNLKNMLSLMHAIGHQQYRHVLITGFDNKIEELEADVFSGYMMKQLGVSIKELEYAFNTTEFTNNTIFPNPEIRVNSILKGWQANEIKIPKGIVLIEKDDDKKKYYSEIALKQQNTFQYHDSGENWVKAFQYSDGYKNEFLFYAFQNYLKDNDDNNALYILLETLKLGYNYHTKNHQSQIFDEISEIYKRKDSTQLSSLYLEMAFKIDTNNIKLLQKISDEKLKNKDWHALIFYTKKMLKANHKSIGHYSLLAWVYENLNNKNEAIKYYKRALAFEPRLIDSRLGLAAIYNKITVELTNTMLIKSNERKFGEYNKAKKAQRELYDTISEILEEGLITNPESRVLKYNLLQHYRISNDTKKAKKLMKLIDVDSNTN